MDDSKLQRRQNALSALGRISLKASSQTIAVQMHLTALNAKSEPDPALVAEFDDVFAEESPDAIKWAFRIWRDQSSFFPAISDIRKLVESWHREKREIAEAENRRAERKAEEQARREGKLVGITDIQTQLRAVMAAQPEPEHMRRHRQFQQRMKRVSAAIPTLHLSEEEIQSRREKERAEIERYRQRI